MSLDKTDFFSEIVSQYMDYFSYDLIKNGIFDESTPLFA